MTIKKKKKPNKPLSFTSFWKFQGSCSQATCLCLQGKQPPRGFAERPSAPDHGRGPAAFLENKGRVSPNTTCVSWEPPCARARRPLCTPRGWRVGNRWQDSGRRQAEGLVDITTTTTKRRIRVQREYRQWKKWEGGRKDVRKRKQGMPSTWNLELEVLLSAHFYLDAPPAKGRERLERYMRQPVDVPRRGKGWNTKCHFPQQ